LFEAEAFAAVASVAMPAVVTVADAVSVATPVAVADSWFSCILGYLYVAYASSLGGGRSNRTPKSLRQCPQEQCPRVT
jgi:uncharacterized membrane protein (DUF485 family)